MKGPRAAAKESSTFRAWMIFSARPGCAFVWEGVRVPLASGMSAWTRFHDESLRKHTGKEILFPWKETLLAVALVGADCMRNRMLEWGNTEGRLTEEEPAVGMAPLPSPASEAAGSRH